MKVDFLISLLNEAKITKYLKVYSKDGVEYKVGVIPEGFYQNPQSVSIDPYAFKALFIDFDILNKLFGHYLYEKRNSNFWLLLLIQENRSISLVKIEYVPGKGRAVISSTQDDYVDLIIKLIKESQFISIPTHHSEKIK